MKATSDYLNLPLREEVEVCLGKLMAAIDDAQNSVIESRDAGAVNIASVVVGEFSKIVIAKDRYDAARLARGGAPELHNGMVSMQEEVDQDDITAVLDNAVERCKS